MYNNQEYISANFTTESNLPKSPNYKKTPHKVVLQEEAFMGSITCLKVSRHRKVRILFRAVMFPFPMCHIRPTHRVNLWMCRLLQNRDFPRLCR